MVDKNEMSSLHDDPTTTTRPRPPPRLKGILRMLQPHYENESSLITYPYLADLLGTTQVAFQTRRKRHRHPPRATSAAEFLEGCASPVVTTTTASKRSSSPKSFVELVGLHKFVCFFIIQDDGNYQSNHVLTLRQRLATGYHDCMTVFVVPLNSTSTMSTTSVSRSSRSSLLEDPNDDAVPSSLFAVGTGFTLLPPSALLRTVLNVTQVPTVIILDTSTGRPLSPNASLALQWNAPHEVLQAWHTGHSGLTTLQLIGAIVTCQGQECCAIL
jgi:hypothetical protein